MWFIYWSDDITVYIVHLAASYYGSEAIHLVDLAASCYGSEAIHQVDLAASCHNTLCVC